MHACHHCVFPINHHMRLFAVLLLTLAPLIACPGITDSQTAAVTFVRSPLEAPPGNIRRTLTADIDNDGRLDIVIGGESQSAIYRNTGNRGFRSLSTLNTSVIAAGDMNNDGALDLVGNNTIFLGDGEGAFVSALTLGTSLFAVGDLNGDGWLDIVGYGVIYLNDRSGQFIPGATFSVTPKLRDLALGDMNNDGYLDIVVGNSAENSTVGCNPWISDCFGPPSAVLLNDGSGSLVTSLPFGNAYDSVQSITIGDVNSDDNMDVVTGNRPFWFPITTGQEMLGGQSRVYINDGYGNLTPGAPIGSENDGTVSIALGDLNGDTYLDIIAGNMSYNEHACRCTRGINSAVYFGTGKGAFGTPQSLGAMMRGLTFGDVSGDGAYDIVAGDSVYYYVGTLAVTPVRVIASVQSPTRAVAVADLNGDRFLDIVMLNAPYCSGFQYQSCRGFSGGEDYIFLNNGQGDFLTRIQITAADGNTHNLQVGDIDNNGTIDLLLDDVLLINDGQASFTRRQTLKTGIFGDIIW